MDDSQARFQFLELEEAGLLVLSGRDAVDFLQRLSTNEMSGLDREGFVQTVFTNEKGRVMDITLVVKMQDERLLLIGQNDIVRLRAWLERFIIMEDITVEVVRPAFHRILWSSGTVPLAGPVNEDEILVAEKWPQATIFHHISFTGSGTFGSKDKVIEPADIEDFKAFRIDHKIPWFGNEVTNETNPLEAGIGHLVSFSKGCYVGQEVIARLDTFKKVQRSIVRFRLREPSNLSPSSVRHAGKIVGAITTTSKKRNDSALGYLQRSAEKSSGLFFEHSGMEFPLLVE